MTLQEKSACTAFAGLRMIATGNLIEVALQTKQHLDSGEEEPILIFDDETSDPIEIDFRGPIDKFKTRMIQQFGSSPPSRTEDTEAGDGTNSSARGRGRPKLGVISREVTLLPRHWEWLNHQPGGASVALRKLVEEAKRANVYKDVRRDAQESTYKFMSAMAGYLAGFEEASRALFALDAAGFAELIDVWPPDIKAHLKKLSVNAMDRSTSQK